MIFGLFRAVASTSAAAARRWRKIIKVYCAAMKTSNPAKKLFTYFSPSMEATSFQLLVCWWYPPDFSLSFSLSNSLFQKVKKTYLCKDYRYGHKFPLQVALPFSLSLSLSFRSFSESTSFLEPFMFGYVWEIFGWNCLCHQSKDSRLIQQGGPQEGLLA